MRRPIHATPLSLQTDPTLEDDDDRSTVSELSQPNDGHSERSGGQETHNASRSARGKEHMAGMVANVQVESEASDQDGVLEYASEPVSDISLRCTPSNVASIRCTYCPPLQLCSRFPSQ